MPKYISPDEFKRLQDREGDFTLVDTRGTQDFNEWHAKGAVNFPFSSSEDMTRDEISNFTSDEGIGPDDLVVTICAKGVTSFEFAEELEEMGYEDVVTVKGGMEAWSGVYDVVPIATTADDLVILQMQRRAKGCLGYLVGSKKSGLAAAVDVSRYTYKFIEAAGERGLKITNVFDTHIHADHISGGRYLAERLNIPYHLGKEARGRSPEFDFNPLENNQVIEVGEVLLKALHTPGHTTEMTSYLINGEGVITGDSLFLDSIGRTELEFDAEEARTGASLQYESLSKKLLSLPERVKVLPSHFTVKEDGTTVNAVPGTPLFSTIGTLRDSNEALGLDEERFIDFMFDNLPSKPPNYEEIIALNLGKRELAGEAEATELELGPNRCATSEETTLDE